MQTEETRILYKFCAAILEARDKQPYRNYVAAAVQALPDDGMTAKIRANVTEAIIMNLLNNKKNPFDSLARKYDLPLSSKLFSKYKYLFANALAAECGFSGEARPISQSWTKEDVLNMLYSIAGEANECITDGEGSFNHQVAGVALKAIDQAVRLSGMNEREDIRDSDIRVELSDEADLLGA